MQNPLEPLQQKFTPDPDYPQPYTIDQRFMARWVGIVALGLPFVMIWAANVGLPVTRTCFRDSISHFYYAPFYGDVLVGALCFIGAFLIAYRGESGRETRLATFAGIAAFGVAIFPTTQDGCGHLKGQFTARLFRWAWPESQGAGLPAGAEDTMFALFTGAGALHYLSAAVLFTFLAGYSFIVFPRVLPDQIADGTLVANKKTRNRIYYLTGIVIVAAMLIMLLNKAGLWRDQWDRNDLTFWCEAAALWAFGLAWLVKGRFWGSCLLDPGES